MEQANKAVAGYDKARILLVPPPLIQGIGSAGGYRMMLEDREDRGYAELNKVAQDMIAKANQSPSLAMVYTLFDVGTPRIYADVDRRKADLLGVPPERIFEAMQVYLGSAFVNDFNLLGRTYRVTAQADAEHRGTVEIGRAVQQECRDRSRMPSSA
eukprot:TRINITY_DN5182_c0_g1_i2.p2 TRINITY_DN5182_c0_g1~~TRINITY_DN5182_c0_g1_i2.p2  ORF type:complete len:156 (-),score=62.08 TRINITY_DN5182_c0_g1_i2:11-478(-)